MVCLLLVQKQERRTKAKGGMKSKVVGTNQHCTSSCVCRHAVIVLIPHNSWLTIRDSLPIHTKVRDRAGESVWNKNEKQTREKDRPSCFVNYNDRWRKAGMWWPSRRPSTSTLIFIYLAVCVWRLRQLKSGIHFFAHTSKAKKTETVYGSLRRSTRCRTCTVQFKINCLVEKIWPDRHHKVVSIIPVYNSRGYLILPTDSVRNRGCFFFGHGGLPME